MDSLPASLPFLPRNPSLTPRSPAAPSLLPFVRASRAEEGHHTLRLFSRSSTFPLISETRDNNIGSDRQTVVFTSSLTWPGLSPCLHSAHCHSCQSLTRGEHVDTLFTSHCRDAITLCHYIPLSRRHTHTHSLTRTCTHTRAHTHTQHSTYACKECIDISMM